MLCALFSEYITTEAQTLVHRVSSVCSLLRQHQHQHRHRHHAVLCDLVHLHQQYVLSRCNANGIDNDDDNLLSRISECVDDSHAHHADAVAAAEDEADMSMSHRERVSWMAVRVVVQRLLASEASRRAQLRSDHREREDAQQHDDANADDDDGDDDDDAYDHDQSVHQHQHQHQHRQQHQL